MKLKKYITLIFLILLPLCLWVTFRNYPFSECGDFIRTQKISVLFIMFAFSSFAFLLMGLRWFLILRFYNLPVALLKTVRVRLVSFFWSYVTPGSQVGGEYFLVAHLGVSREKYPQIISSVILDRFSEYAGNVLSVLFVVLVFLKSGQRIIFLSCMLCIILIFAFTGKRLVLFLSLKYSLKKWIDPVSLFFSENRKKPSVLFLVLSMVLSPLLMFLELLLFFHLTGSGISPYSSLLMTGAVKLSFYAPVPGAAGFFEAAVIGISGLLRVSAAASGAYILYSRVRDLIQLAAGFFLWLAGVVLNSSDSE